MAKAKVSLVLGGGGCRAGGDPATLPADPHDILLKPHLVKTFKISRDKHFVEKLQGVVGLYLNPPDKALGLNGQH
jgi:hypothetical protein